MPHLLEAKLSKKILLIDDQRTPEMVHTGKLDENGGNQTFKSVDVEVADRYNKGIEALERQRWDLLLLDHDLSSYRDDGREMTGYDVLCWLEEHPEFIPAGIRLVTANPSGGKRMLAVIQKMEEKGQTKYEGWS